MKFRGLNNAKEKHIEVFNSLNRKLFTVCWREYDELTDTYKTESRDFKATGIDEAKEHIDKFYELDKFEVYDNKGTKLFTEEDI